MINKMYYSREYNLTGKLIGLLGDEAELWLNDDEGSIFCSFSKCELI